MDKNIQSEDNFVPVCSSEQMELLFWLDGDFNTIRFMGEKNNKVSFSDIGLEEWKSAFKYKLESVFTLWGELFKLLE